jgi:hypothetical protein
LGLASLHASALALGLRLPSGVALELALLEATAALLISLLALGVARWAVRGDGRDSGRLLFGVSGLLLGGIASLVWFRSAALLGWAPLAALSAIERQPGQRLALALQSRLER